VPFQVRPAPELAAVEVRLWGQLAIEELRRLAAEAINLAEQTGFRRALADCFDYLGGAALGEVFVLTEDVSAHAVVERGIQAFITPRHAQTAAELEFYVNTARALGNRVQMFATRQAAIEWLNDYGAATDWSEQRRRSC